MSTIDLSCAECEEKFSYSKKEHRRQTARGRTSFFCGMSCARRWKNKHRTDEEKRKHSEAISKRNAGNSYRKMGDFTHILNRQIPKKTHDSDITEAYLRSIWTGRCVLTGIPIELKHGKSKLNTASLDRIDSSKGYYVGNVQFVSYGINLAKSTFTTEEMTAFIESIRS